MVCGGTEQTISDCSVNWLTLDQGKTVVSHVEVAGVTCVPNTPPPGCQVAPDYNALTPVCNNGAVYLEADIVGSSSGLLQYCYNGQWTGLCTLDTNTAAVACRQLGYTSYSCKLRPTPLSLSPLSLSLPPLSLPPLSLSPPSLSPPLSLSLSLFVIDILSFA